MESGVSVLLVFGATGCKLELTPLNPFDRIKVFGWCGERHVIGLGSAPKTSGDC